ncbi:MAG: hypothetical protein JXM70_12255, partial [Pirellulales bacterium]|nr:hypothetical protein [Pirellulales bacterium]
MLAGTTTRCHAVTEERNGGLCVCVAGMLVLIFAVSAYGTPLDDYVTAADASYTWGITATDTTTAPGCTLYTVQMTSQTWRDSSEVDHNAWQHYMRICVPNTVTSDKVLLTIGGRDHGFIPTVDTTGTPYYGAVDPNLALATGSVVAAIATVPNQPLQFAGEGFQRYEDAIIAKTGRLFMDGRGGGDPENDYWLALMPMVKSA